MRGRRRAIHRNAAPRARLVLVALLVLAGIADRPVRPDLPAFRRRTFAAGKLTNGAIARSHFMAMASQDRRLSCATCSSVFSSRCVMRSKLTRHQKYYLAGFKRGCNAAM